MMYRMGIAICLFFLLTASFAETLYPFENRKQEAQFQHLLRELRCLVCQNQDLADSNAELAKDLRNEVYHLVTTGKSDIEITNYLTARYGDFILFNPPIKTLTWMLWFGPVLFMVLGLWVFWLTCLKRRRNE